MARPLVNIGRFRWTPEEKQFVSNELLGDPEVIPQPKKLPELASVDEYLDFAKERVANFGQMQGLSTGYPSLDDLTKGLVGGELIIVSGQTAHGKTQLAVNISYRVLKEHPVLFVSLEMTKPELTARFEKMASDEGTSMGGRPLFYQMADELEYADIDPLIMQAKRDGAALVVIDHLHYFVRSIEFAASEIGKITKEFKRVAIKYDIPVMLLAHVRKIVRGEKPHLDDLRDSSFIAQDSDIVLMIWRELENPEKDINAVKVTLLKNRNRGIFTRGYNFRSENVWLHEDSADLDMVQSMFSGSRVIDNKK